MYIVEFKFKLAYVEHESTWGVLLMSIVTKSIVNADAEARYLSPGELDRIKSFVLSGKRRLRIAQILTDNRELIVKQGGQQLFQKRPDVVSPGGNAYGEEMTATCLRDLDYYLRLVEM